VSAPLSVEGAATAAVVCRGLRKVYSGGGGWRGRGGGDVVAVAGIDLSVARGECFGLLGPNGAGKTTTVEILEGLNEPTSGEVSLCGLSWRTDEAELRQRIGVALQETRLSDKLSVGETLELFGSFYRRVRSLESLLDVVQLHEKRDAWVSKLSGGQRQRLALACALVGEPEILFLDEPTTGLDPQSRRQVWDLVNDYRACGGTVLLTTHYMEEAERLCDRVAIVDHGRIIREGSPRELIATLGAAHVVEFELAQNPQRVPNLPRWAPAGDPPTPDAIGNDVAPDEAALRALPAVTAVRRDAATWSLTVTEPHRVLPALIAHLAGAGQSLARLGTRQATLEARVRGSALAQLTLTRILETVREPGTMFWVFGFPILLSVGLGLAFRNRTPEPPFVGVLDSEAATSTAAASVAAAELEATLQAAHLHVERLAPRAAAERLRSGKIALLVVPPPASAPGPASMSVRPITYRFDPTRAESLAARDAVDRALQTAAGRRDPRTVKDDLVSEPGTRYIDFLIPGLIGMNVMSGSMWGIGWVIVNMRVRKLLKRMLATPMRRRDLLLAHCLARLLALPLEVATIVVFARLAFHVALVGSLLALGVVAVTGALSFAAMAVLVASRAENTQTFSGLMNLVMMPMFVLSGVFFSSAHFPELMQPLVSILPLTALNDALRAVMIDGASLAGVARPLGVLAAWGITSFAVGVRIFRWA